MKRFFILLIFFVALHSVQVFASAASRVYYWNGDFGYISINLNGETDVFVIEYSYNVSDDIVSAYVLSSGRFRQKSNGEILFEDSVTGITMKAIVIKNAALKFVSGYDILDNKTYHLDDRPYHKVSWPILKDTYSNVAKARAGLIKGDYYASMSDGSWQYGTIFLTIEGTRFSYDIRDEIIEKLPWYEIGIPILYGTWSQNGNLIILHDEHTNHDFYLIYEYPNLRTMLLPGDLSVEGTVLTRQ
jgi:hypothetical protein